MASEALSSDDGAAPAAPSRIQAERLRAVHVGMVEAVLAGDGLAEVAALAAAAAGAPVAVIVSKLGAAALSPDATADAGALRRYVAERSRGRPVPVPDGVVAEAAIATGDEVLGGVLLLGRGVPEAGEFLQIAALAALTEVAVQGGRAEVEHTMRDAFFDELRARRPPPAEEILRRAARLGSDLRRGAVGLCAELTSERPRHVLATLPGEHAGALAQQLENGRVYALLPAVDGGDAAAATLDCAQRVAKRLRRHGVVGLSSFYGEPGELGRALGEAELVVDVLRRGDVPSGEDIGSGAYRLLFRVFASHPDEVRSFYEDTVAPLVRYDERYGSELVPTLETFLERNCATGAAAAALFVHRHTITYRLERVRELTGLDPAQSEDRERLGLGLKAYRIVAPRLPR